MKTYLETINDLYTVEFNHIKYRPSTLEDPEQPEEFEVLKVFTLSGEDISKIIEDIDPEFYLTIEKKLFDIIHDR